LELINKYFIEGVNTLHWRQLSRPVQVSCKGLDCVKPHGANLGSVGLIAFPARADPCPGLGVPKLGLNFVPIYEFGEANER